MNDQTHSQSPSHSETLQRLDALAGEIVTLIASHRAPLADSHGPSPGFKPLALELFQLQFALNSAYQAYCRGRGVQRVGRIESIDHIPAIPTPAFKQARLSCLEPETVLREFQSSGTTDHTPGRHLHSQASLQLYEASLIHGFQRGLIGSPPTKDCRIISLTPPTRIAPQSSLGHMCETVCRQWGDMASVCIGELDPTGSWDVSPNRFIDEIQRAAGDGKDVGILGTAFGWVHLMDALSARGKTFELGAGAWAMETGGYKGRSRVLTKPELHSLIAKQLGIHSDRIVCEYGMSELSSQAYDRCLAPSGHLNNSPRLFRFPPWARARIVSPETGSEVSEGEIGMIQVFDLANAYSAFAIQTEDLGRRSGDGFEWIGRIADTEPRGCSLLAKTQP